MALQLQKNIICYQTPLAFLCQLRFWDLSHRYWIHQALQILSQKTA